MTTPECTDSEKKFYDAAKELQATGGYWATFSTGELAEWLRQHGHCAYCGVSVVDEYHVVNRLGTWDHLLPKSKYPELVEHPLNKVVCCTACNQLKGRWDPNLALEPPYDQEKGWDPSNEELQKHFIDRAMKHIELRRKERLENFQREKGNWERILKKLNAESLGD